MVAFDLTIMNDSPQKLGYLSSEHLSPMIVNDVLTPAGAKAGEISMPVEFWLTADSKKTLMVLRGSASDMRSFSEDLSNFIK